MISTAFLNNPFFWALISMFGLLGAGAVTSSRNMASRPLFFLGSLLLPAVGHTMLVLALGKPVEQVVVDEVGEDGSIKYWRDEQAVHHVPKRALDDLIL